MTSLAEFDVRRRRAGRGRWPEPRLRVALRAGRARPAPRHRPRDLRRGEDAQGRRRRSAFTPANGAVYPRGRFGESLRQIAQLIRADVGARGRVRRRRRLGHARGAGQRARPAGDAAQGVRRRLAAFDRDLGDRMRDVVVLTMSEFGRTVRENGNRGTDHGHGTAMFVMGGGVQRRAGLRPLARASRASSCYEGRDLAVTTDFREPVRRGRRAPPRHAGVSPTLPRLVRACSPARLGIEQPGSAGSRRTGTSSGAARPAR